MPGVQQKHVQEVFICHYSQFCTVDMLFDQAIKLGWKQVFSEHFHVTLEMEL